MELRKTRLVFVTTVPITLEAFFRGQFVYWKQKGFEVIAISSPGTLLETLRDRESVMVFPVPMIRGLSPISDLLAILRLYWLFKRLKPEIVHASTPKAGFVGMIAATLAGVPVRIFTLRGLMSEMDGRLKAVLRWMEKLTCKLAHTVTANSGSVAKMCVSNRFCSQEKLLVLGHGSSNGVDASDVFNPDKTPITCTNALRAEYGIPESAKVIGFVGRIVKDKGIFELANAWVTLRRKHLDSYLMIVGKPEARDAALKQIIDDWGYDERVVFTGWIPRERMATHCGIMDVLALPTYREGFPNVVLEAAATGVPVVASKVTGCVDAVVDGVTGTLVPAKDPVALADAIEKYIVDPELRRRHGQAGRTRALNDFQPEMIWNDLHDLYIKMLKEKGLPIPKPMD